MKNFIFLLVYSLLLCGVVTAQPLDAPKDFYKKGYVLGENQPSPTRTVSSYGSSSSASATSEIEAVPEELATETPVAEETPSVVSPEESFAEGKGERVLSVSLLIAVHDVVHFAKYYKEFLDLSAQLKVAAKDAFLIGDTSSLFASAGLAPYAKHKVQPTVRYFSAVPEPFRNVQSSPALIVETAKGVVVIEGYRTAREFFTREGTLIDPSSLNTASPSQ